MSASDEPRCSICGGAHREVDWHVKEEAKAREYFASLVTRAEIARVNNAMYEQPSLALVLVAVVAEVARQEAQGHHGATDDPSNLYTKVWLAACNIREAMRLRTEGA